MEKNNNREGVQSWGSYLAKGETKKNHLKNRNLSKINMTI